MLLIDSQEHSQFNRFLTVATVEAEGVVAVLVVVGMPWVLFFEDLHARNTSSDHSNYNPMN